VLVSELVCKPTSIPLYVPYGNATHIIAIRSEESSQALRYGMLMLVSQECTILRVMDGIRITEYYCELVIVRDWQHMMGLHSTDVITAHMIGSPQVFLEVPPRERL
jgi:hypothetical protein